MFPAILYTIRQPEEMLGNTSMSVSSKGQPVVYARPASGTRTGRVWEIADEISRETGRMAARREVLERVVAEGGNRATANTQYQYWRTSGARATDSRSVAEQVVDNVAEQPLSVATDGRLMIPREMREAMNLDAGGRVTACVVGGELRLLSTRAAIRRIQAEAERLKTPGSSEVEAFLADRRAMWGEEQASAAMPTQARE